VLGHPFALHYNGSTWTQTEMPESGTGTFLHAVTALSANDVWAVGSKNGYHEPVAYHWNGSAWSEAPISTTLGSGNNILYGVAATAANQVWAVGYSTGGSQAQPLVLRWNGTAFSTENVPQQQFGGQLNSVAATGGPSVFAAGTRTDYSSDTGSFTDHTLSMRGSGS
jgi:hypothetical protein